MEQALKERLWHIRQSGDSCSSSLLSNGHRSGLCEDGGKRRDAGGGHLPGPYRGS